MVGLKFVLVIHGEFTAQRQMLMNIIHYSQCFYEFYQVLVLSVIGDNLLLMIRWFPQCHDWWDSFFPPRYFSISIAFSLPAKFSSGYSQVFQNRSLNVAAHHPKPAVSQSSGCFSLILQILSPGLMWPLTRGWWHSASDFF